jgi:3-hydroxyisobutyrate dehydrogenase-like beta-hydroxyacid dehydrogenase
MAKRLLEAGFTVKSAVHRNKAAGEEFAAAGGRVLPTFPEAVKDVDLVISIVPGDAELLALYGAPDFFAALPGGAAILEMTSCAPSTMKKIVADYRGKTTAIIDAPVSGGTAGAASGGLTIFAAGDAALIDELGPVLDVLGKTRRLPEAGDGKTLKAVNQMLAAVNMVAVAEAFALAKKLGLDPDKMGEIVKESSGGSYVFANKFPKLAKGDFSGGFKFSLMKKDLDIARNEAKDMKLPLLDLAGRVYDSYAGPDNLDFSVLGTLYDDK